jgi:hypothetical protein
MRKTLRFSLFMGILAAGAQLASSHGITIVRNDIEQLFATGNRIVYHHDTLTAIVDLGVQDGPEIWDFSGLNSNYLETLRSVPVSSTLYGSNFPQATHALIDTAFAMRLYTGATFGWVSLKSTQAYYYYGVGDAQLYYGVQGAGNAYLDMAPTTALPFSAKWFEVPAAVDFTFPVAYNGYWTQNYVDSLEAAATIFGSPQTIRMGDHYSVSYSVDAYGSLVLPGGAVYDALRIRKLSMKNGIAQTVGYTFLARNGAAVQMTGKNPAIASGTDSVTSVRWTEGLGEIPVPVELSSFTGVRHAGTCVSLEWTTLSETNNFGFNVQRRAPGDLVFSDLTGSFVGGHGTTLVPQTYSYQDVSGGDGEWWYRLKQVDLGGAVHYSEPIRVVGDAADAGIGPGTFELQGNYPNPFNPVTTIGLRVAGSGLRGAENSTLTPEPSTQHVRLAVYDLLGREVAVLLNEEKAPGTYEIRWDASKFPSGVYFCRMTSENFVGYQKMVLAK